MFDNAQAKFTFSFAGHFEGATPTGPLTVAGTLHEGRRVPRQRDDRDVHHK